MDRTLKLRRDGDPAFLSFELAPANERARSFSVSQRPWQPADKGQMWRVPLFPWSGGLMSDRLFTRTTYAKANADASNDGFLTHPPLLNTLTMTNSTKAIKMKVFNGTMYVLNGRYVYTVDTSYAIAEDKDLGVGVAGVDMEVFNNELIVAVGASTKIFKRTTTTWSQATDNTYAIALGVVDQRLYRAENPNLLSSCTTTPLTLANWTPASPNQYPVGDSTFAVNTIIDYGGIPWVGKADGMYAPDPQGRFHNQTPQLKVWPNTDNCKGAFVAQGYLWIPTEAGLIRVSPGKSIIIGPEVTNRPGYRLRVRGGCEFAGNIYLIVEDSGDSGDTFICKMMRNERGLTEHEYIYHEFVRLGGTADSRAIAAWTNATNPAIMVGYDTDKVKYLKLGRGGGRDVDDSNYAFGTSMEVETGIITPLNDRSIVIQPIGVEVTLDYAGAGETLYLQGKVDNGSYVDLLDSWEYAGTRNIALTNNVEVHRRYFPPETHGQHLEVKFVSTLTSATGTNRPEIYEAWAFGFAHPASMDVINVRIAGDGFSQQNGLSTEEIGKYFRDLMEDGSEIEMVMTGFEHDRTITVHVSSVQIEEVFATLGDESHTVTSSNVVNVELTRAIYGEFSG